MLRIFSSLFLLLLLLACQSGIDYTELSAFEGEVIALQKKYAPDRRTDRVDVNYKYDLTTKSAVIEGITTVPAAFDCLKALLAAHYPTVDNAVRLLPDTAVGATTAGIIKVSVANLRSKPGHSQELATQALLGTPIEVLDKQNNWYLVRTPDRYLAWLEPGAFAAYSPKKAKDWLTSDLSRYLPAFGFLRASPRGKQIVSDLVAGNLLLRTGLDAEGYTEVSLPDNQIGWVPTNELGNYTDWQAPRELVSEVLLEAAASLAGRPYLWGGTSPKGMDCSGFTKTAYYLNGYVIPRDASQQVHAGTEVELTKDFANLLAGDLLFFGRYREDGSQRITHVGMYLGEGRFLHAGADNGRITENSLSPSDSLFAEHRLKSLLRAKRLSAGAMGVVTVKDAFQQLAD
ncbi:MAG: SH3 domain-containing C40 family peptidase [Bacteroidota bacterium]